MPTARIALTLLGEKLEIVADVPDGQVPVRELLPAMYAVDDVLIAAAVRHDGKAVSCQKGCSACCRAQPVPITPPEVAALQKLVDDLPEPRRTEVRERFADRVRQVRAAGLFELLSRQEPITSAEQARQVATDYHRLGIVCPFLEADACSIHPQRPFVCRQYLVTSPAELCADPLTNPIAMVRIPAKPASALLDVLGSDSLTVPLVLALDAPGEPKIVDAELTFQRWIEAAVM